QAHEARNEIPAALAAYEEVIAFLREEQSAEPEVRRLLGLAWMNRGNALQKLTDSSSRSAAISAYDEAIVQFHSLPFAEDHLCLNHLGAAWLNRGHAQLLTGDFPAAAASFEHAIPLLQQLPLEANPAYRLNLAGA